MRKALPKFIIKRVIETLYSVAHKVKQTKCLFQIVTTRAEVSALKNAKLCKIGVESVEFM